MQCIIIRFIEINSINKLLNCTFLVPVVIFSRNASIQFLKAISDELMLPKNDKQINNERLIKINKNKLYRLLLNVNQYF